MRVSTFPFEQVHNAPMGYPDEIARVTLHWAAREPLWTPEIALNTFHLRHHHTPPNTFTWSHAVQFTADRIAAKLVSHWATMGYVHSSLYGITGVTVAQLDSAGKTVSEGSHTMTTDEPLHGVGTHVMPPETAICLSMYGYTPGGFATQKGRKRGRIYLPYISRDFLADTGTVDTTGIGSLLDGWASFLNDVQGMAMTDEGDGLTADYAELVVVSSVGAGLATQVQSIVCDNHFDSQRRRQHQAPAVAQNRLISH